MLNGLQTIALYENVLMITCQMLEAARQSNLLAAGGQIFGARKPLEGYHMRETGRQACNGGPPRPHLDHRPDVRQMGALDRELEEALQPVAARLHAGREDDMVGAGRDDPGGVEPRVEDDLDPVPFELADLIVDDLADIGALGGEPGEAYIAAKRIPSFVQHHLVST